MKKQKRVVKTREQIVKELQGNEKFQKKLKFVKEQAYPALIEATKSIDDATSNLSIINSLLMEKFLGRMKEVNFVELDIVKSLSSEDPKYEPLKKFLELFYGMSAFEAKEHLEGLKAEISLFLNEENKNRSLSDLKTKWLDETFETKTNE